MSSLEPGGKTDPSTPGNDTGGANAVQIQAAGGQEGNPPADLQTHNDLERELWKTCAFVLTPSLRTSSPRFC